MKQLVSLEISSSKEYHQAAEFHLRGHTLGFLDYLDDTFREPHYLFWPVAPAERHRRFCHEAKRPWCLHSLYSES